MKSLSLINWDKLDVLAKQTLLKSAIIDIGTQPWASIKESKNLSVKRFSSLQKEK